MAENACFTIDQVFRLENRIRFVHHHGIACVSRQKQACALRSFMAPSIPLTPDDRARYEWQLWADGFGEVGQARLGGATVLVTRIGGVGGILAHQLAAAGVGKLILAHAGNLRVDDLNRQLLMSHAGVGQSRVEQAARRLREFNPLIDIEVVSENVNENNVEELVRRADAVACCAPLFAERLLLNRAAVAQGKPLVDCAMFEFEIQLVTVVPGQTPCLACLYPQEPPAWQRRFPVFGAAAGAVGCLGAMEIIKLLSGLGERPRGRMLVGDLRTMEFRNVQLRRNPECAVCGKCGS
jgi:molybdopterin-synthase adenylyltransferase